MNVTFYTLKQLFGCHFATKKAQNELKLFKEKTDPCRNREVTHVDTFQ